MTRIVLTLTAVLMTGCSASLVDVRHAPLVRQAQVPGTVPLLAQCLLTKSEDAGTIMAFHLREVPDHQRATLTATRQIIFEPWLHVGLEYTLIQVSPSLVQVELRTGWPDGGWLSERTWPLVEACARTGS